MKNSLSCVQETKFRDSHHLATLQFHHDSRFQHRLFVSDINANSMVPNAARSGGVLTVLRSDFPGFGSACEQSVLTIPGRYLVVRVSANGAPVYIHNVYAPVDNLEKKTFFEALPYEVFEDNATHLVLGDLNTPLDPLVDASDPRATGTTGGNACIAWLAQLGVIDAWRIHHPDERVYTGPQPRRNRLDYILMSDEFCNALYGDSRYFEAKGAGDHLAHQATLRAMTQPQGHGYWRFQSAMLDFPDIVQAIEGEATAVLRVLRSASNPGKVWHDWKKDIRRQLQALQRKLKRQGEAAIAEARASLAVAAATFRSVRSDLTQTVFQTTLTAYHDSIDSARLYNQDSAFDFQAQHAEKSSKYFFRPLDGSLRRVSIEEVHLQDGSVSNNPADIASAFCQHWGGIMGDVDQGGSVTPDPTQDRMDVLLNTIDRRLSGDERELINAPITAVDLTSAIKKMRASSAPGMDGLPASFYQVAPNVFGECLEIVFNYQRERGELLQCQRKSAISLLHKKGPRTDPGNYRPIALMGVDVKALSKVLTFRLQLFLTKLVHQDQKAFVRGRSLHHHVRFVSDLQDLVTARDDEAYAMFLDFEKAYDRVNWNYMFHVLDRMGCGGAFSEWVKLLYTRPQAHLMLNGHVQDALYPTRGVKQGDPLSALLFLLVIEPLGNLLRQHEEYGVCLTSDVTTTSVFFADDSTLLSGTIGGVEAQLELVDEYCQASGAKLNVGKCVLMSIHRTRQCPDVPGVRVLRADDTVKFLGLLFGQQRTTDLIVEDLDRRFFDGFRQWFRRARTLPGRLLVAQTMVLSRLWHYTAHVAVPLARVKKWQAALHRFVLSRRYERDARHIQLISKEFVNLPRADGGLQIPRLEGVLKRQSLQLLLQFAAASTSPSGNWTRPGVELLRVSLPQWGPQRALDFLCISPWRHGEAITWDQLSPWWRAVWKTWYGIQWPLTWRDLPIEDRLAAALGTPIWFHGDKAFHYTPRSRTAAIPPQHRSLSMIAEPQRGFRKHIAGAFQLRSLRDFAAEAARWPTAVEFAERHVDYTHVSVTPYQQYKWLLRLHKETTQVFERLCEMCSFPVDGVLPRSPDALHPRVGVQIGDRKCWVPRIPRSQLLRLVWQPPVPTKTHPLFFHDSRAPSDVVRRFNLLRKRLRTLLLPIYDDLQFRLAYGLLPTRSRFSFMTLTNPDIVYCVWRGCNAVETARHLFFECTLPTAMWRVIFRDWSAFFASTPSWVDIVFGRAIAVVPVWNEQAEEVNDVWQVIRAVTLHLLWSERNGRLFNGRSPMPPVAALRVVYTTVGAHLRACLRKVYDDVQQASLRCVLTTLQSTASLGVFMQNNLALFEVRFLT